MFAKFISLITSPFVIIPIFGLCIIAKYSLSINDFLIWGGIFIILIILCPLFFIYYKIKKGEITDLHIAIKKQRAEPFLLGILSSFILSIIYKIINVPYALFVLAIILLINSIIFFLITKFWKISIHSAAFFGSVLIIAILINPYALFFLLILPFIMWARIERGKHNLWQGLISIIVIEITTLSTFYILGII